MRSTKYNAKYKVQFKRYSYVLSTYLRCTLSFVLCTLSFVLSTYLRCTLLFVLCPYLHFSLFSPYQK